MQRYSPAQLITLARDIFAAYGTPSQDATIVAEQLVASNLMGLDSHGVVRIPLYVRWINEGTIKPGAAISMVSESGGTAIVDCGYNFGQVGGLRGMEVAIQKAREHKVSCVVLQRCCHVGRLGYFTQMAAEAGMFALATVNSPKKGAAVVPFGGLEGRLAPNPISFAAPGADHPLIADMALSTVSEGKVRIYRNRGQKLPEGWIIDSEGRPSVDPEVFYGNPRGWLLPLGGSLGYKGFAFLLMAEILSGTLGGEVITVDRPNGSNGACFIVLDISAFTPVESFRQHIGEMGAYMKSAPPAPGFTEVMMPGEPDFRAKAEREAQGIPIEPVTWGQICEVALGCHVPIPEPLTAEATK